MAVQLQQEWPAEWHSFLNTSPPNKELKLTKPSIMELRSLTLGGF
jgi:hypothetical protein